MAALSAQYVEILRRELLAQYVPHLPPLLLTNYVQPPEKQVNRALSAFAVHALFGVSATVAAKSVIDDFMDNGIDAIHYQKETETLHLIQSKFKASEEFRQDEAQDFCTGVKLLLNKAFTAFNQNVIDRANELRNALGEVETIQLWVVYTGSGITETAKARFQQLLDDTSHGESERLAPEVRYMGPNEIEVELRRRNSYKPVEATVYLSHDVCIKEPRMTWYGMVSLKDLVELHVQEEKALYEKNIRYYLGSERSDVNKGIQNTLTQDPQAFFYLNNGITALCNEVAAKDRTANRRKLKIRGLSIINGAQTVASAAELMQQPNPPDISKARVMFTLIQANADGSFGAKVTRARNSQNAVQTASFSAQDPQQERLAQELLGLGITYHVRPEAKAQPSDSSILLEEAIVALSWLTDDPRYPVWLKSGRGEVSNADSPAYQAIFRQELIGAHLANAVFFYREVARLLEQADQSSTGQEKSIYRHGSNAIGWSYMKRLRLRIATPAPINPAQVSALISQSFDEHRQLAVETLPKGNQNLLSFFKSQANTNPYLIALMERAFGLGDHAALPALKQSQASDELNQERLFRFLSQQAPQI
jgi:AIPR protein